MQPTNGIKAAAVMCAWARRVRLIIAPATYGSLNRRR